MSSTTFQDFQTPILASWLNDVDSSTYQGQLDDGTLNSAIDKFKQIGTGAVARTVQDKLRESVSVLDFGAVGTSDDTTIIQTALTAATLLGRSLLFPAATYTTMPLTVPSNSHLVFAPGVLLKAKTGYGVNDRLLNISNVSNISIDGNHAVIQMLKSEYISGEQRAGVFIATGTNITINDLHVKDTGGDGFYIGSYDNVNPSVNVTLNNCYTDNARRNGLSIVSVKNCWINGGEYANTIGTSPEYGVDIEANYSSDSQENINLIEVSTRGNALGGIQVVFGGLGATANTFMSVNIEGCHSYADGHYGALRFANPALFQIAGAVNVSNHIIENPAGRGVDFINMSMLNPRILIRGMTITNPAFSMASPGNIDLSAISLATQYNSASYTTGNITFENITCLDNRASPIMFAGAYVGGTYPVDKVTFKNVKVINSALGRKVVYVGICTNISAVQDNPEYISINGTTPNIERYGSGDIFTTSSPGNLTLASCTWMQGIEVDFAPQTTTLTIVPSTGETIFFQGTALSGSIVLEAGDRIKLKAISNGWRVLQQDFPLKTGSGTPVGAQTTRFPGRMYYDSTGKLFWMSTGTTGTDWKQITN